MKNLIFGAALLICGMIGIASVTICCGLVVTSSIQIGIGILFGAFSDEFSLNLTMPLIIFIILLVSGLIFSIAGFRNKV